MQSIIQQTAYNSAALDGNVLTYTICSLFWFNISCSRLFFNFPTWKLVLM